MAVRGYTAEVEEAFLKAARMSEDTGQLPQRFPVLRSLASLYALRAEFDKAIGVGQEMIAIAEGQDDPNLDAEAHLVVGASLAFTHEDTEGGMAHIDRAIDLFDPRRVGETELPLGPNPGVIALTTAGLLLWVLGFPVRALDRAERALALSEELGHPYTRAYALFHVALISLRAGNLEMVGRLAGELLQVANAHDYHLWRALAIVLQGIVTTVVGDADEGIEQVERGMALYRMETTPPVFWSLLLLLQARAYAAAGRLEESLDLVDALLQSPPTHGGSVAGLWMLRADLLTQLPEPQIAEAIDMYTKARDESWELGDRMDALESATRLVALLRGTDGEAAAAEKLSEIYATFTEGLELWPLQAAKAALEPATD